MAVTGTIQDRHGNPIALNDHRNCQSQNVVHVIQCQNCKIIYVGQTSKNEKDQLNQHRSDINKKVDTSQTFPKSAPISISFTSRQWKKLIHMIPASYTFNRLLDNSDQINILQKELFWNKGINTLTPHG